MTWILTYINHEVNYLPMVQQIVPILTMASNQFYHPEIRSLNNPTPLGYSVPSFPSLYWPFPFDYNKNLKARYLYAPKEVWRFTVLWTLIFFGVVHISASLYTAFKMRRAWKLLWIFPMFWAVIAGIQAFLVGSICGGLLGVIYSTAEAQVSTWIPCVWGLMIALVMVLKLFGIEGITF
jgi:hypothetical protein